MGAQPRARLYPRLELERLTLTCVDSDLFTNDLIGSTEVDLSEIWYTPQHDVYRQCLG